MKKILSIITLLIMIFTAPAWSFDINIDNANAKRGSTINVPVKLKNVLNAIEANSFGFTLNFNGDILSFVGIDTKGTMVENFTLVDGKEKSSGIAKIAGSYFTDKIFLTDGLLVTIIFKVQENASGNTKIEFSDFKDALTEASSTSSIITIK